MNNYTVEDVRKLHEGFTFHSGYFTLIIHNKFHDDCFVIWEFLGIIDFGDESLNNSTLVSQVYQLGAEAIRRKLVEGSIEEYKLFKMGM